jgi:hypothetical protein
MHACVTTQKSFHCHISSVPINITTKHHGTVTTRSVVSDACQCYHTGIFSVRDQQCWDHNYPKQQVTVTTRSVVSDACLCSHTGIFSLPHQQCSDQHRYQAPWYCHYEISSFSYVPVLAHGTFSLRDQQCWDHNYWKQQLTVTTRSVVSLTCLSYHMGHLHCEISSVETTNIRSNKLLSLQNQ